MSKRREDDSRPIASAISQRATVREVPAAKYKDASVGTVAPRGLRGPSLQPGQGAPERLVPNEVELAVLRDAETLDGPKVARVAASKSATSAARSSLPTPVSVEVPRVRSVPPVHGEYASTPPTPSARSIQSGTLMSIGSVDPRAPTELSLPSPRPLSVSERAPYLPPPAVVDRTAQRPSPTQVALADKSRGSGATQRPGPASVPPSLQAPPSAPPAARSVPPAARSFPPAARSFPPAARSVPPAARSVPPAAPSVRPPLVPGEALAADSVAPPAQNFARVPRSNAPSSLSATATPMRPPRPTPTPMRPPRPTPKPPPPSLPPPSLEPESQNSALDEPPQFQIHAELSAVPHEVQEDGFDLRSASTLREPLASRKPPPSTNFRASPPAAAVPPSERNLRANRSSSPAVTILVDRARDSIPPVSERMRPQRAAVPLSWVLGAAAFAVVLALVVAFAMRPSAPQHAVAPLDGRPSAAAPNTAELAPRDATPQSVAPGTKRSGTTSSARPPSSAPKSSARPPSSTASSASVAPPPSSADPNSKAHQAIY
ncbi:MAG TPA: hypothetical protein VHM25_26985 [Polyangiaceae bacterium]|nr:hypothetical protein [Polyangiaceae bacterium]